MPEATLTLGKPGTKKVAIISHERSGTHFLMNSISINFGYIASPRIDLDFNLGLNLYAPVSILSVLKRLHNQPVLNILKSHHPIDFLIDIMDYFTEQFYVFYIYRDPRDVMVSFWKLLNDYRSKGWDEGPATRTVSEFIRAQPRGAILRYQKEQEPTMLHRWQTNVLGWVNYAEKNKNKVITIRYEDLNNKFDEEMKRIAKITGWNLSEIKRPSKYQNVINPGKGMNGTYREYFAPEDEDFVIEVLGNTMKKLGYL